MQFTLSLIIDRKKYNIIVKQIKLSRDNELFEIIGKDRKIYLWSNRPLLEFKGLKNFPITFKSEGVIKNQYAFEVMLKALEKKLKEIKTTL